MKNLILFGDSHFGRMGQKRIAKLEALLANTLVHNMAAGGFTSTECILRSAYISNLHPDYICLSIGTNDCNILKGQPVSLEQFEKNIREICTNFVNITTNTKIIVFPAAPVHDSNDIPTSEKFNAVLFEYNNALSRIALEFGYQTIDTKTAYLKHHDAGTIYLDEDGLHLNDFGYEVLIEEIAKVVNSHIL